MRNFKVLGVLTLVLVLSVSLLAGCGSGNSDSGASPSGTAIDTGASNSDTGSADSQPKKKLRFFTKGNENNADYRVMKSLIDQYQKEVNPNFEMVNLTEVRLEQAKRLLESGSKKASEVAGLVGYKDFSYFIQVFKKHTGLTPNEYKDQRTGEGGSFL